MARWENVRLFQEPSKRFERLTGLKPWCLLQSWLFSRGTDWRLLPLGWAVRRREKSDASCCSRREVNQQGPWFPPNSNYCLFLRLSNPTATLVKSELQGQTQRSPTWKSLWQQPSGVGSWGRNDFKTAIGTHGGYLVILLVGTNALPSPLDCISPHRWSKIFFFF